MLAGMALVALSVSPYMLLSLEILKNKLEDSPKDLYE